jgi:hypothetical protein
MEKPRSKEGHGFSRAVTATAIEGFSPWGTAFSGFSAKTNEETCTSAAKAAQRFGLLRHG